MPVRRDLGSVHAPDAENKLCAVRSWIAGNMRKLASLYDRRPLQISGPHDIVSGNGLSFFLGKRSGAQHRYANKQRARVDQGVVFHGSLRNEEWCVNDNARQLVAASELGVIDLNLPCARI